MPKKVFKAVEPKVEKKVEAKVEVKKEEKVKSPIRIAIEAELCETWLIKHRDRLIKTLGL